MNSETREPLGVLVKLNQARQTDFGELLVDAGHLLRKHARQRTKIVDTDRAGTGVDGGEHGSKQPIRNREAPPTSADLTSSA